MKTIKLFTILAQMLLTSVTANAQNSLVGDVNKDGSVNITDAMMVVDIILHGQKELSLSVNEISLSKGNSATIVITSGYGSYTVSSANTNIADATLSGSTVIITGKKGGTTVVKVIDTISGNMEEVNVMVHMCPDGHHPHLIDLGLPSGTKWACCNVGADKPEAYGGYYAWGETEEKKVYNEVTYQHSTGEDTDGDGWYDKNVQHQDLGNISGTEYDVAHVKWGGNWCMPTLGNITELLDNCTSEWATLKNVKGIMFTSKTNGSSIFLPAAGYRWSGALAGAGSYGYYLSTILVPDVSECGCLYFDSGNADWNPYYRGYGRSVRPVVRN